MLQFEVSSLLPDALKERVFDTAVDFVSTQAGKL
jgi:hypothetical protein